MGNNFNCFLPFSISELLLFNRFFDAYHEVVVSWMYWHTLFCIHNVSEAPCHCSLRIKWKINQVDTALFAARVIKLIWLLKTKTTAIMITVMIVVTVYDRILGANFSSKINLV